MAFQNLSEFLRVLEERGLLKRIVAPVDPELEIAEITDRVMKAGGPTLFFERVKGSRFPLVINLFGTLERMKLALGVEDLEDVARRLEDLLRPPEVGGLLDKIRVLPRLAELASFQPRRVRSAPCQEVIETEHPNLRDLPIIKSWPLDGGPFITLPLVVTRDPDTGKSNLGLYRMQVYDERTTGMHWHIHKDGARHLAKAKQRGERLEVAVALGADPATIYAATAPLPGDVDELTFAGFLRRAAVEVVKAKTVDLEVPAQAEFVLEGYVEPGELRREGPFGDHTGFYSLADDYPVFHLTAITHRKDPVYPATIVGKPPMEDLFLGKATERIFLPLLRLQLPEVVDMDFPAEGVFHNCVVLSIRKSFPGQAKKVMSAVWGLGQMMYTKLVVVVDEDVNVHDSREVWWRVFANIDAARDVTIVSGPLDVLDHSSPAPLLGSKMGIDATRKWPEEGHPREWPGEVKMSREVSQLVTRRWQEYGIRL